MKDDLIDRHAAIDAINKALDRETLLNSFVRKVAVDAVKAMPSALPSATDTNVGGNLSVDELITFLNPESNYVFYDDAHGFCINTQDVIDHLCVMPSAQLAQDLPNTCTDAIGRQAAVETVRKAKSIGQAHRMLVQLPSAQPVEDARAMCGECDAWNKYKNYPQPEQFNPCTVCQEFDCTGCKFREGHNDGLNQQTGSD